MLALVAGVLVTPSLAVAKPSRDCPVDCLDRKPLPGVGNSAVQLAVDGNGDDDIIWWESGDAEGYAHHLVGRPGFAISTISTDVELNAADIAYGPAQTTTFVAYERPCNPTDRADVYVVRKSLTSDVFPAPTAADLVAGDVDCVRDDFHLAGVAGLPGHRVAVAIGGSHGTFGLYVGKWGERLHKIPMHSYVHEVDPVLTQDVVTQHVVMAATIKPDESTGMPVYRAWNYGGGTLSAPTDVPNAVYLGQDGVDELSGVAAYGGQAWVAEFDPVGHERSIIHSTASENWKSSYSPPPQHGPSDGPLLIAAARNQASLQVIFEGTSPYDSAQTLHVKDDLGHWTPVRPVFGGVPLAVASRPDGTLTFVWEDS